MNPFSKRIGSFKMSLCSELPLNSCIRKLGEQTSS